MITDILIGSLLVYMIVKPLVNANKIKNLQNELNDYLESQK